jgi:hypothetical protein
VDLTHTRRLPEMVHVPRVLPTTQAAVVHMQVLVMQDMKALTVV